MTVGGLAGVVACAAPAAAQLPNQSFEVIPQVTHATVGDSVPLRFRVRLDQVDLLYDSVPQPASALSDGVRLLSVAKLQRQPDRTYTGRAVVAFYRVGRQAVPVFALPFMRGVKGLTRGTLTSDTAFVEIDPVVPRGNPPLKDIRGIVRQPSRDWRPIVGVGALATLIALGMLLRARRRRAVPQSHDEAAPPAPVLAGDPYERALARLAELERSSRAAGGDVARRYEASADTLRQYLDEAHGIPAPTRTTRELFDALLPPRVHAGAGKHTFDLLSQADLVKFALMRPEGSMAAQFIRDVRTLITEWHAGAAAPGYPQRAEQKRAGSS
ncbi:MAG TPA: hypothetical protein VFS11_03060 [Gemmatimonadales bacterium]|nr:hypothetical protein [Gemmatimonadales bacterium]